MCRDWGRRRSWWEKCDTRSRGRARAIRATTSSSRHSSCRALWTTGRGSACSCRHAPVRSSSSVRRFLNFAVDQKPFNYTSSHTGEFGAPSENSLSTRYQDILQEQKRKFIDYVERPSKYTPEAKEPLCLGRQSKYFKSDAQNKEFGFSTHTTWETF